MNFGIGIPRRELLLSCGSKIKTSLPSIYYHSGRTDAAGGHHDRINKTGRGFDFYHYHHGFDDHLHPNGICEYGNYEVRIFNPYTGQIVNLGQAYFYKDIPYFSLNLISKALTADYYKGAILDDTGGMFYACPAGNSTIEALGNEIVFEYPKNIFGFIRNNTFFDTNNGELKLLCCKRRALLDNRNCYAYISLNEIGDYMKKDGYFTHFGNFQANIWSFKVKHPSVAITMPLDGEYFNVEDEVEVKANIESAEIAQLIVSGTVIDQKYNLGNQGTVTFKKFKLTDSHVGLLPIEAQVHIGGTAIEADMNTETDIIEVKVEEVKPGETDDYFAIIKRDSLNVRATPSQEAESLLRLGPGDHIRIVLPKNPQLNEGLTWIEAYYEDGKKGWIAEEYLHPNIPVITDFPEDKFKNINVFFDDDEEILNPIDNWGLPDKNGSNRNEEVKKDPKGRYLVAVGPRIIYKDYPNSDGIQNEDLSGFSRHIEVELAHKTTGSQKVIQCYVNDLKAHSYNKYPDGHEDESHIITSASAPNLENGIVQTGIRYPFARNSDIVAPEHADGSVIEFKGWEFSDFNLSDYKIIRVVSNSQRTDLFVNSPMY
jgi:hypothetical protein